MPAHAQRSINTVLLSFPSLISLAKDDKKSPRSWIQLARTGAFKSRRYGEFSITKTDLSEMLHNFKNVTPKEPTELPVDYDHLSMDPKKPGDGIAAGWFKDLQLRGDDDDELWGEVAWTPEGAERIRNGEYRFVSPSFVKNHTHKDGEKIGTTLLAAAITNHPFLEGMQALTLYNFAAMGDLALAADVTTQTLHLAEVGQRVMIAPGNARTQDETGATFEISEVVGDGDDAFVAVKDATGMIHKWFRATELLPASSVPANPQQPPLVPGAAPVVPPQAPIAGLPGAAGVPPTGLPGAPVPGMPGALPGAPAVPGAPPVPGAPVDPALAAAAGAVPGAPLDPAVAAAAAAAAGTDPAAAAEVAKALPGAKGTEPPEDAGTDDTTEEHKKEGAVGGEGAKAEEAAEGEAAAGEDADAAKKIADAAEAAGADPADAAAVAAKTVVKKEEPGKDKKAVVAVGKKAVGAVVPGAPPVPGEDEDPVTAQIRQAVMAALAAGQPLPMQQTQKGMHMKFMLRNDKNEEIEVTAEQLEKAGVKVVPEGSVAVPKTDLDSLKGEVTNLSERLNLSEKNRTSNEFAGELKRLKEGAFITGAQEEFAKKMWGDTLDLSAFRAWAATFTQPILALNREHGSSADGEVKTAGEQATAKIISLAASLARERGINLSEATKIAGAQLANEAESYREQFAETR